MRGCYDPMGGYNPLIDKMIGDAFPDVAAVARHLAEIVFTAQNLDKLQPKDVEFRDNTEGKALEWRYVEEPVVWKTLATYDDLLGVDITATLALLNETRDTVVADAKQVAEDRIVCDEAAVLSREAIDKLTNAISLVPRPGAVPIADENGHLSQDWFEAAMSHTVGPIVLAENQISVTLPDGFTTAGMQLVVEGAVEFSWVGDVNDPQKFTLTSGGYPAGTRIWCTKGIAGASIGKLYATKEDLDSAALHALRWVGDYVLDFPVTLNDPNEMLTKDGLYWIPFTNSLPFYSSGNWSVDSKNLTPIGDVKIRKDLSNSADYASGAGLVGFSRSNSYPKGTLGSHCSATILVTDDPYSASPTGDATAAFLAAYNDAPVGGVIVVPGPGPYLVTPFTGDKEVTWDVQYDLVSNLALLKLPGIVKGRYADTDSVTRGNSLGSDFALKKLNRTAGYSGGVKGNVCSNLRAYTNVTSKDALSFEWVGTFVLDNAGQGQNVAVYGQANRLATSEVTLGGTFGACFEATDKTNEADPHTGLIGMEVDVFANGTDVNGRRIGIDLVTGKGDVNGTKCEVYAGIRIGPSGADTTKSRIRNCILISGDKDTAFSASGITTGNTIDISTTSSKTAINIYGTSTDSQIAVDGSSVYGMRFTGSFSSGTAIRLNTGLAIAFEGTNAIQLKYLNAAMRIFNAGVEKTAFSTANGAISVSGLQVIGPRDTGWASMIGNSDKATVYDPATMTLPQLAGRVAALQQMLATHGIIGV